MKSKSKTKKVKENKKDTKKEIKKSTTKKIEKVKKSITNKNKKVDDETKIKKKIENEKKKDEVDKKKDEVDKKKHEADKKKDEVDKKKDEVDKKKDEVDKKKDEDKTENKSIKRVKTIDLLDKYGYDIYNDDEKRQESLGNLVIVYGVVDLIKKLDSESSNDPNMITRFNNDKKWIKNNFKKK